MKKKTNKRCSKSYRMFNNFSTKELKHITVDMLAEIRMLARDKNIDVEKVEFDDNTSLINGIEYHSKSAMDVYRKANFILQKRIIRQRQNKKRACIIASTALIILWAILCVVLPKTLGSILFGLLIAFTLIKVSYIIYKNQSLIK